MAPVEVALYARNSTISSQDNQSRQAERLVRPLNFANIDSVRDVVETRGPRQQDLYQMSFGRKSHLARFETS
jgi:hypothetical protein